MSLKQAVAELLGDMQPPKIDSKKSHKLRELHETIYHADLEFNEIAEKLVPRVQRYYLVTNPKERSNFFNGLTSQDLIAAPTEFFVSFINTYDNKFGCSVKVPWNIIDMTDEEFNDWVEDQEETKRILLEAKIQADELKVKEARRKQYEKLKEEFGDE